MNRTLDLHGVKHQDVQSMLDSFIFDHMKRKTDRVYVITGRSMEMKRIVSTVVREYGFTAVENMFNPAEILVDL